MNHQMSAYGPWSLVVINSAVFLIFAFSFSHPRTKRDWRSFGASAHTRGIAHAQVSRICASGISLDQASERFPSGW